MAVLKDLIVNGASRFINTVSTNNLDTTGTLGVLGKIDISKNDNTIASSNTTYGLNILSASDAYLHIGHNGTASFLGSTGTDIIIRPGCTNSNNVLSSGYGIQIKGNSESLETQVIPSASSSSYSSYTYSMGTLDRPWTKYFVSSTTDASAIAYGINFSDMTDYTTHIGQSATVLGFYTKGQQLYFRPQCAVVTESGIKKFKNSIYGIRINSDTSTQMTFLEPLTTEKADLGSTSLRWATLYGKTLNLSVSLSTGNPIITMSNSSTGTANQNLMTTTCLAPNLVANGCIQGFRVGKAATTKNLGFMGFQYVADGSASNNIYAAFYGDTLSSTDISRFYPGGKFVSKLINVSGSSSGINNVTAGLNIGSAHLGENTANHIFGIESLGNVTLKSNGSIANGTYSSNYGITFSSSALYPSTGTIDLGTSTYKWNSGYINILYLKNSLVYGEDLSTTYCGLNLCGGPGWGQGASMTLRNNDTNNTLRGGWTIDAKYSSTSTTYSLTGMADSGTLHWSDGTSWTQFRTGAIELYTTTPYIDFHRANSTADYTARITNEVNNGNEILKIISKEVALYADNGLKCCEYDTNGNLVNWNGDLYVGRDGDSRQYQIVVRAEAGNMFMYAQGDSSGNRGIFGYNASGTAQNIIYITQDGNVGLRNGNVYVTASGSSEILYGAAWNDYAEYRKTDAIIEPGRCIVENGDDSLRLSTKRLERGCEIVSDTFGFAIGQTDECQTPTAASGRVLAYIYEGREAAAAHIGWPVCSGPNGTVSIMTEEEEEKYPSRIIGTISAVPNYETWNDGNVKVNGRVWIRIR